MTFHIGAAGPGTDEGAMKTTIPSPPIASASGTSMAAFGGRSFCARTRTAITDVQVTLMRPSGGQFGDGRAHPLRGERPAEALRVGGHIDALRFGLGLAGQSRSGSVFR